MADVPSFEDFKRAQPAAGPAGGVPPGGGVPDFEQFKAAQGSQSGPDQIDAPGAMRRFAGGFASALNPLPAIGNLASEATAPGGSLMTAIEHQYFQPQADQMHRAADEFRTARMNTGLPAAAAYISALGHGLAGAVPLIGPAAAHAGERIGTGDVAGGLGEGTGLIAGGALLPEAMRMAGKGLSATAEPLAENASGIAYGDRAWGRNGERGGMTPGRFALDYTRGVRPGAVADQAQTALRGLNDKLHVVVGNAPGDYHLAPARAIPGGEIQKAQAAGSTVTPPRLQPMADFLGGPAPPGFKGAVNAGTTPVTSAPNWGGQPTIVPTGPPSPATIAEAQPPLQGLAMKRQFGDDFVRNYNPISDTKGQLGVARQTQHAMADELHRVAPGSKPLDVAMSAGIPIAEKADIKALRAGPVQNMINRFGAHTGALTGAIAGGVTHGVPGAIAGLAIPEFLANPTVQMIGARGLDLGGKILRSPARYGSYGALPPVTQTAQPQQ
jgi:hypothetical protein